MARIAGRASISQERDPPDGYSADTPDDPRGLLGWSDAADPALGIPLDAGVPEVARSPGPSYVAGLAPSAGARLVHSPDGRLVANLSIALRVWDSASGSRVYARSGSTWSFGPFAFSPDASRIAVLVARPPPFWQIVLFDVAGGEGPRAIDLFSRSTASGAPESIAWAGDRLAVLHGDAVHVFDAAGGAHLAVAPAKGTSLLGAGETLAVVGGPKVQLLRARDGSPIRELEAEGRIELATDGARLFAATREVLRIVDVASGSVREARAKELSLETIAFISPQPDGSLSAGGMVGQRAQIVGINPGEQLRVLTKRSPRALKSRSVPQESFVAGGILFAGTDRLDSLLRIDLAKDRELPPLSDGRREVRSVAFSADGRALAMAGRGETPRIFELTTGKHRAVGVKVDRDFVPRFVSWSPKEPVIAIGGERGLVLYDVAGDRELGRAELYASYGLQPAFTRDGSGVLAGGLSDGVRLFDAHSGKLQDQWEGDNPNGAALSPDGALLVVAENRRLRAIDVAKGLDRPLGELPQSVSEVVFDPDGKEVAAVGWDDRVHVLDALTGRERLRLEGHRSPVTAVAWRPGGPIATGSDDGRVILWEAASGRVLADLEAHPGGVSDLSFSPSGRLLASAGADGVVWLWSVARAAPLVALVALPGGESLAYTPDGAYAISAKSAAGLRVWTGGRLVPPKVKPEPAAVWRALAPEL